MTLRQALLELLSEPNIQVRIPVYTELGDGLVLVLGVERGVAGGEVHDGAIGRHHPHPENVLRPDINNSV